jgi:uncharacterized protein YceH (UPF0502 family)
MKYKVQDHPGLVRDQRSKAIISEDTEALQRYLAERNYRQNLVTKNQGLETEIHTLKTEVAELKDLVRQLLEKR